jgi:hypothetical protein
MRLEAIVPIDIATDHVSKSKPKTHLNIAPNEAPRLMAMMEFNISG